MKVHLVDGTYELFRSFFGAPPSTAPDGREVGATKGILITTSGFGPTSYQFATGKPLQLIDGTALLALCHHHHIPARIIRRAS